MSLLFPGEVRKVAISGAGVRVCRDFTEISTHYSNAARILTAAQAADAAVFIRRKAFIRHISF